MDVPECMNPSCAKNRKLSFHWPLWQVHPQRVYRHEMRVSGERRIPSRITTDSGSMDIPVASTSSTDPFYESTLTILTATKCGVTGKCKKKQKKTYLDSIRLDVIAISSPQRSHLYVRDTVILAFRAGIRYSYILASFKSLEGIQSA